MSRNVWFLKINFNETRWPPSTGWERILIESRCTEVRRARARWTRTNFRSRTLKATRLGIHVYVYLCTTPDRDGREEKCIRIYLLSHMHYFTCRSRASLKLVSLRNDTDIEMPVRLLIFHIYLHYINIS